MERRLDLGAVAIEGGQPVLATDAEVDEVERRLGLALPPGYREYVTTLGEGQLDALVRVYPPWRVLEEVAEHRGLMAAYWFWNDDQTGFGQAQAVESVPLADTLDGDVAVVHPEHPGRILLLPRDGERLVWRSDFLAMVEAIVSNRRERATPVRSTFAPHDSRTGGAGLKPPSIPSRRGPNEGSALEVLLAYFAELAALETWGSDQMGGAEVFMGATPPLVDTPWLDDQLLARSAAIHGAYCTPALAEAMRHASVSLSAFPAHSTSVVKVLDQRTIAPGQVAIRTDEGMHFRELHEYVLEKSDDGWRVAMHRDLGSEERERPGQRGVGARLRGIRKRLRDLRRDHFKWGKLAVSTLTAERSEAVLRLRIVDVEVIPSFDGSPQGMAAWLILATAEEGTEARGRATELREHVQRMLLDAGFPSDAVPTFDVRITTLSEIEKGGGRRAFFH